MQDKPRQAHYSAWIVKKLKKQEDDTMTRARLWHFYRVDPSWLDTDTSAGFSVALKTLLNNGKAVIVFIDNVKCVKLV